MLEVAGLEAIEPRLTLVSWREGTEQDVPYTHQEPLIEVIRRAGHPPDGVLVLLDGTPLPMDRRLEEGLSGKKLTVIRVASGG